MENSEKIIELINKKQSKGYKFLYDHYYASLGSFASHFFKQKANAEDIVQDVFLKLWKSDTSFNSMKALTSYLYTSVKNASLNAIRDNSKLSDIDLSENDNIKNLKINDKTIEQVLIEEEYYRKIYIAIEKLSPKRKKIILLSMEGLTNKEIAKKLNVSVNTVKTLKLKAYKILREELEWAVFFVFILLTK